MNFKRINKYIPIPAYFQLKEIIREKIESGELKTGEKIPSENKLSELYQISRMTARQAIRELVEEGLLYREKGKGTFVASPKFKRDLLGLNSLTEEMKQRGYKVITKVLDMKVIPASKEIAHKLEIVPEEKVVKIDRLRLANHQPFFLETSFLPFELCPGLVKDDLAKNSLYFLLEEKYGLILDNAIISIEAVSANVYHSSMLKIKKGAPLLLLEQTTYLNTGRPIQFLEAVCRSDKYKYYAIRKRRRNSLLKS